MENTAFKINWNKIKVQFEKKNNTSDWQTSKYICCKKWFYEKKMHQ